ncbi:hypothetical protein DICPUDRAFT_154370 [Dictyostelium purpureum]|uniref:C2 domain-containing protein n=1 Tax=Dictyostelium purpureum TaxID=5786 RepID=F0ZR65_DICPU|nr:uncharacterized protein DICPUDRAFT_154370 [Dictyostelium purpureum]EGC33565.1 hypothetical protein DICPUDRAFT_154370 [Dictyostelium purpureum]|eukprot:XP_003289914.1 hypothetical protein DICPUDRAFT_154370 [Dictyostelium purpureum]
MQQQQQQQQQQISNISSPNRMSVVSSPSNFSGANISKEDIPTIVLNKTPLVKNNVELDFSAKASKEGMFSLWSNALERKKINYSNKEMTIMIEPPEITTDMTNSKLLQSPPYNTTNNKKPTQEDLSIIFELVHYCIFYSLSNTNNVKRDILSSMNNYFCQIIREKGASNVKIIINSLFEVFGYYLDIARKEEEDDPSAKKFTYLIGALEKFIEDGLNKFRDASEFSLTSIQKSFTTHLTDQFKKQGLTNSTAYNDALQKFNFILSCAVESVEAYQKSQVIKSSFKLDAYLEKTLFLKSKALSSKEYLLAQLRARKHTLDHHPYYNKENFLKQDNFYYWRKQEEATIVKLSQQMLPREEYLKSQWGIKVNNKSDPIGVLAIKVVSARELFQKEEGKPESYLEIQFGRDKKRTKKVSGLNPVWKEHYAFQISKGQLNDEIEFTIWDNRTIKTSSDKIHFLGKYKFTVKELMLHLKREVNWYPLQKRTSRSRISGDIKLQFHYLPFPDPTQPIINDDYVNYLEILLDKLIETDTLVSIQQQQQLEKQLQQESGNDSLAGSKVSPSGSGQGGVVSPLLSSKKKVILSQQSNLLLKEFCERYGIMDHTLKLFIMKRLVHSTIKYHSLEYIPEIRTILKNTLEIKFGDFGLTKNEDEILVESVTLLSNACKTWLLHFHAVFPQNLPSGSLRMLIDIYYLLRNSELSQLPPLPELIRECYLIRYRYSINLSQDLGKSNVILPTRINKSSNSQHSPNQQQSSTPPQQQSKASLLVKVCDLLLYNLDIDQKYFSRDFPNDTPILIISIQIFTEQLSKEVDELTEKGANSLEELQEFFELYLKLKETMTKFKEIYPKLELVPIPVLFKQVILQWTLVCADQLKNHIDRICAAEKWNPVSHDTLHSASVGEVILGCYHALDVIKSLRWEDLQKDHKDGEHTLFEVMGNFTMVISESIIYYTKVIRDISLNSLDQAANDIFQLSESYSSNLEKTIQTVSLRFNNIQATIGHAEDLIQVLLRIMSSYRLSPSIVNNMATNTYLAINNNVLTLVDRIYERLSPIIQGEIYKIVGLALDKNKNLVIDFFQKIEKNFDQLALQFNGGDNIPINVRLEPLLNYITSKLQIFSKYLYYPLTKQLLKRCWAGIINAMDEIIFPSNKKLDLTSEQLDIIEGMIKAFSEFFYVDGEGLTQKQLDKQSERFMIIVLAYREAINSGVRDFDPLGLKNALKNINFKNLKPDLTYLKKLNINLKGIPKQLDVFSLIKRSIDKRQEEKKKREENRNKKL